MRKFYLTLFLFCLFFSGIQAQSVSLTGGTYSQDFNTLSNTAGSTTNNLTIPGWYMIETGGGARDNEQYAVDAGASNTGDTYSYGSAGSTDRALGGLQSGTLIPVFGASFVNNTGVTITSLSISYTGEEWRLGTAARTDQLTFEYSTNATDLATGTWTNTAALNFITPNTATVGGKDGNAAANRTAISAAITGLSIPNGATVWIRWTDLNASGADDGLAIDDFTITPNAAVTPNLSINDFSLAESNSGTVTFSFTASLSSPAGPGGVTFDITTADGTATIAGNDYVTNSLTAQTIAAGLSSYTFNVTVNGDATPEPNETFFVNITNVVGANLTDGQGQGTILNDDVALTPIHDIQGNGNSSPVNGTTITTSGIVTGRRSNGFFIQEPEATVDADPLTSEGIFVFTSSAPPAAATVGNLVQVTGTVTEFIPATDPDSPPQTELVSPTVVQISTGNPLPAAVTITAANTNPAGGLQQLEPFESMRVNVASFTVVAPTGGSITETAATAVTNGSFYGVVTGVARPFREAGVRIPDPLPGGAPVTVTRWDANPEIIGVNSTVLGAPALDVATDAVLTNLTGVLDFRNRFYTIDIDPAAATVVTNNNRSFTALPVPTASEMTVGSLNLQRFYDNVNDAGGDVVLTSTAYNNRLNKASLAIRNVLRTPDVLGVIEVENLNALQALANKINSDAVAASEPNPNYVPYLVEGNDVGLIDVGFLVKSTRVTVNSVTQYGLATTYINPNTSSPETLNDRPPLVLDGTFIGTSCVSATNFKVIVNHLRSLNGVDDAVDGNRVRIKRQQQAEFLANLIQSFQTADPTVKIVSVGDYNAFEFSDGYVDVMGTIKGTPAPATDVVLASADLVNPDLVDLITGHTASEKYSYSFDGSAQTLDHILVNANMNARLSRFAVARLDADFPEVFRSDANRPERISDHDAPVAYFTFPAENIPPVITCPAALNVSCAADVPVADISTVTAIDNCPGTITITHQGDVISAQTCANRYTLTRTYRATDAAGNFSECTQTVTVNDQTPPILTCPPPVTVCGPAAVPVPDINSVTGVSDNCGGVVTITFISDVNNCPACVNTPYTITRTYRATDACGNFTECTQLITVNPVPDVTSIANLALCNGAASGAVNFSGAVTGTVFNWTNSNTAIGLAANGTGTIPSFNAVNTGTTPVTATITVTPVYTNNSVTCSGTPQSFTITVNPTPTVNAVTNQTVCNGSPVSAVNFSGAVTGTVFNWTNNTPSIGLGASGSGNITSFNAVNTGTAPVTATITVTPAYTNGGVTCSGTPVTVTITVNPTPTVNAVTNRSACNGATVASITFTSPVAGVVFNWTRTNQAIGLAATSGTGAIPAFTATNTGTTPLVSTFTVTAVYTNNSVSCTSAPVTFTVTVNPLPTVSLVLPFDTLYQNPAVVQLTGGSPTGGVFSGAGVSSQGLLNPAALTMGNYAVNYTYTDPNGCSGSASDQYTVIARTTRINVYPNPTNGKVKVVVTQDMVGSVMEVFDMAGQQLSQYKLGGRLNEYYFPWAAGTYNLVFQVGSERIVKQILIAH